MHNKNFKAIITLIICFACFNNFVKHLNSYSNYRAAKFENVQLSHIFKRDKLILRKDPLHC